MDTLRIFVGYDSREPVAYHVLCHSILARASKPVLITPLVLGHLRDSYTRQRGPTESTEFSITRFLVPYLSDYHGYSLFLDSDMLCLVDIYTLLDERGTNFKDVWVCPHDYTPKAGLKMDGKVQTVYQRKNWSSVMLFNNASAACKRLTPEYVNTATGLELHRFQWCEDDRIGNLPLAWNHLVGEENQVKPPKLVHFTRGGPWFKGLEDCEYSADWFAERDAMLGVK